MKQLHGNSSRFVRELMQEERAFISKRVKSTDRNIRDRARVVDLSSEGVFCSADNGRTETLQELCLGVDR